jgi:hypothetical protein
MSLLPGDLVYFKDKTQNRTDGFYGIFSTMAMLKKAPAPLTSASAEAAGPQLVEEPVFEGDGEVETAA